LGDGAEQPRQRALEACGTRARLEEAVAAFDEWLTVTTSVWPSEWVNQVRARKDDARAEIERRMAKIIG
jgi:hypothetical protein